MYKITVLPGDGIGPEITDAVKKIISATGIEIEWEEVNAGEAVYEKGGYLSFIKDAE